MFKRPILNTVAQVAGKTITVLISLVTTGILTRKLGVEVYGSFTLVTSVFLLLDSLADFGIKIIGVRETSTEKSENKKELFEQLIWLRLMSTGVAFVLGIILIFLWSGFAPIRGEALVALSMIWFTSLAGSMEIIFQSKLKMELKVFMDVAFPLIFLIVLWFWPGLVNLLWVFLTYLFARVLSLVVGSKFLGDIGFNLKIKKINWIIITRLLKESWPMGVYLIVFAGYDRAIDSMLIQKYVGLAAVAWYGLAYKIYSSLVQPAYFFVNSIFPLLSADHQESEKEFGLEWKKRLFKTSALLLVGSVFLVIPVIYFMAPWIIQVLAGNQYAASAGVLRILLIALFFSYIEHLIGFTLISRGGQKEILWFGLIALVFNLGGNLWAIPRFGIYGAAWVTVLTEALACSLMSFKLWQMVKR